MSHFPKIKFSKLGSNSGVAIVAVFIIIAILSLMGGVVTHMVATGSIARTNDLVSEQSFDLVHAGMEYALKRLDDGINPDGDVRYLGSGRFTVAYDDATGKLTSTADVSAMFGSSNPSFSIQGPISGGNMSDCLQVDISGAAMNTIWWPYEIVGAVLKNTCSNSITIASMTVSWTPLSGDNTVIIALGGTSVYQNYSPGAPPGTPIDITDYTINSCSSVPQTRIRFSTELPTQNFNVLYTMSDGSSKNVFYQFHADNEAACLEADLSAAYPGFTNNTRIIGGTLTNACSPPTSIGIKAMRLSWLPAAPIITMSNIFINGAWRWFGIAPSGTLANFFNPLLFSPGQSFPQNYITFNDSIVGRNFSVTYIMRDNSELTVPVNFYAQDMASCLSVHTSGMRVSDKGLIGQSWVNTCPAGIVIDRIRTKWTGLPGQRRLTGIVVNGVTIWNQITNNDVDADVTDVYIGGGSTATVDRYQFNNPPNNGCFTHTFTMFDGTSLTAPTYCP
ncbi:MAG TPA: hypothetical protein PKU96_04495 [bacterium]|nr:hypothetical protein [bacterium]